MVGRLAAAEIVVVHRRQIVVNERVGVDALDSAGEGHGVGFLSAAGRCRREQNGGAHPLAAGEERVAHRLVDGGGLDFFGWQKFVERRVDGVCARGEKLVQVERLGFDGHNDLEKMPETRAS